MKLKLNSKNLKWLNLKQNKLFLAHVLAPVAIGIFIYLFFRDFEFCGSCGNYFPIFKQHFYIPSFILYNLPDGLWMYSLIWILIIIWRFAFSIWLWIYLFIAFILSIVLEFGQAVDQIPGTFDLLDIYTYIVAFFIGLSTFLFYKIFNKNTSK